MNTQKGDTAVEVQVEENPATSDNGTQTSDAKISKNQLKKLEKRKMHEEMKLKRKAIEKEQKKEKREKRQREYREEKEKMTEEEWQEKIAQRKIDRTKHKQLRDVKKENLKNAMESGQKIILDLEFSELMRPEELRSLAQQVMFSYASNSKAEVPCSIVLTGCNGSMKEQLMRLAGYDNWLLHKFEGSFLEMFPDRKDDIVYLTADSNTTLTTIEKSKIYVIGGLVDRNRNKNVTLTKAKELGVSTAKLPIDGNVQLTSSSVLTVNQVVDILLHYVCNHNWEEALKLAIPPRKRGLTKKKDNDGESSNLQESAEDS